MNADAALQQDAPPDSTALAGVVGIGDLVWPVDSTRRFADGLQSQGACLSPASLPGGLRSPSTGCLREWG